MNLKDCHNFEDFRKLAKRKLPSPIFHYIDGGSDDEVTLNRNTDAFNDYDLIPNILNDDQSPLFNRAISGNYPPASIIKPFIGLLGLKEKAINWNSTIEDKGIFQINGQGRRYRGWKEEGHGKVNLKLSLIHI